jgi:hypothetical protein
MAAHYYLVRADATLKERGHRTLRARSDQERWATPPRKVQPGLPPNEVRPLTILACMCKSGVKNFYRISFPENNFALIPLPHIRSTSLYSKPVKPKQKSDQKEGYNHDQPEELHQQTRSMHLPKGQPVPVSRMRLRRHRKYNPTTSKRTNRASTRSICSPNPVTTSRRPTICLGI